MSRPEIDRMSQTAKRPSRAKTHVSLVTAAIRDGQFTHNGEQTYSGVLREPAYVTPRFPDGIEESTLAESNAGVQRETMAYWFLANFQPANWPHFGFTDASPKAQTAPAGLATANGGQIGAAPMVGGFDNGTWLEDGGDLATILIKEFGGHVAPEVAFDAFRRFDGLWKRLPPDTVADPAVTADQMKASLGAALDSFEAMFRALVPEHGGMGHNGDPDGPMSSDDAAIILRALPDMRLALASDAAPSILESIWSGVSDVMGRLGAWMLGQTKVFFDNYTPAAGKALAVATPIFAAGFALWCAGAKVTDLIGLAEKLLK
jgi:hypothetical protein